MRLTPGRGATARQSPVDPLKPRNNSPYRRKSTSRRPRPKSEWIKVALPDELKLISRELWEAVQQQIDRNPKLSPRNTKFKYLLQGLGICEFCSGRLTGRYCKDRYATYTYYTCARRCRKLRWIPRSDIENAVWTSVKTALLDPTYLESRTVAALKQISNEGHEIEQRQKDTSLKDVEEQERTIFRQYQNNRISSQQLSSELERLNRLRLQILSTTPDRPEMSPGDVRASVTEFCERIKARLENPSFEIKQQILRHLITTITSNNESVRIAGALPEHSADQTSPAIASPRSQEQTCNRRGLDFELGATMPSRKRRWQRRH